MRTTTQNSRGNAPLSGRGFAPAVATHPGQQADHPLFNNDRLIDAIGQIDREFIAKSAAARAQSLYGAGCTVADVEYWTDRLNGMAEQKRALFLATPAAQRAA